MERKNILIKYEIKEFSNQKFLIFYIFDTLYNSCESGSLKYDEQAEGFLDTNINENIRPYVTWKPARKKTGEKYIKLTLDL